MRSTIISIILVVIIGLVIVALVKQPASVPNELASTASSSVAARTVTQTPTSEPVGTNQITELRQLLKRETLARQALEKRVESLNTRLLALSAPAQPPTEISGEQTTADNATAQATNTWFNEQALLDAGMDSVAATELKQFYEQMEMDQLLVRDQAIREGWANTPRFGEELQAIADRENELKNRLDEKAYDAYLYASGQNNRVEVSSVLANSPASTAGLQSSDQITRYDGERIYDWRDLREATTQGNANETILVEVLRDNKQLQFYIPRGPLGIRMNSISAAP